ncbi:MAG: hypothetical protein NTZ83_00775 [Candidatus Pacearchaeota archaeon]|nr:hypothetical protein [Candidatus Pacearchaeota archaeon]
MGLFSRKNKKEEMRRSVMNAPELPELPKLPELPPMHELSHEEDHLPQLPTFPNSSLGNKFSQNIIKESVAGKKEGREVFGAEDFPEEHRGMMQKPLQKSFSQEYENYQDRTPERIIKKSFTQSYDENGMMQRSFREEEGGEEEEEERTPIPAPEKTRSREATKEFAVRNYMTKKAEPVFIRIDKFEESMKVFQSIKSQISEIENLIKDTKDIKAKEEQELASWEKEIQTIKNEIEKVDSDIFSRVE